MVVSSYDIDQKFYLSNTFKAYLLTAQSMVGKNIDMLQIFSKSYREIIALLKKLANYQPHALSLFCSLSQSTNGA